MAKILKQKRYNAMFDVLCNKLLYVFKLLESLRT